MESVQPYFNVSSYDASFYCNCSVDDLLGLLHSKRPHFQLLSSRVAALLELCLVL